MRPTSDKVREAVFDVLASLDAIAAASVLDLFAGSGGLGIEALSRSAEKVTFVEQDRQAVETIEENLSSTKLADPSRVRVVALDAFGYLASSTETYDVAFCDPPYDFDQWPELLAVLPARLCVLESNRAIELSSRFSLHRVYRYGGTLITVAKQVTPPEQAQ